MTKIYKCNDERTNYMNPEWPIFYSSHLAVDRRERIEEAGAPSRSEIKKDIRDNWFKIISGKTGRRGPTRKIQGKMFKYIIGLHSERSESLYLITLFK